LPSTDCIGLCKSNYHKIVVMTAPSLILVENLVRCVNKSSCIEVTCIEVNCTYIVMCNNYNVCKYVSFIRFIYVNMFHSFSSSLCIVYFIVCLL
jgi:hypothetical protein